MKDKAEADPVIDLQQPRDSHGLYDPSVLPVTKDLYSTNNQFISDYNVEKRDNPFDRIKQQGFLSKSMIEQIPSREESQTVSEMKTIEVLDESGAHEKHLT